MSGCDVLAVFAHPDDESLLAGGILAACVAAGLRVGIASLTRGELGPIAVADVARSELGSVRERELQAAARELGVDWARCLDFPDGDLRAVGAGVARDALAGLLEPDPPRAVLTFASEGLYWHPDHIATHGVVHAAFDGISAVYEVTWPQGLVEEAVAWLAESGVAVDLWGIDPRAFGTPPERIVAELDVSRFAEAKLAALRCHRTQLTAEHLLASLDDEMARALLGREWLAAPRDCGWLADVVASAGRA